MAEASERAGDKGGRAPSPEQVWVALSRAYRAMSTAVERSLAETGLGLTDFMLLEALLHKGPLTITQIQESVLLATGSMTAAVDRVERRGLIARRLTEADRRARVLELTEEGRRTISAAYQEHVLKLREWVGTLTQTERGAVFGGLRKIEASAAGST